ncbi:MAG: multiprotein bridging factor aMBF1 [Candidatus Woesearchaeota archaeon]
MQCDLCGKEAPLFPTEIEGTTLNACKECSRHGKVLKQPKKLSKPVKKKKEEPEYLIVSDYATRIRNAREKAGLTQEQFGKRINEKVSFIQNLEGNKIKPSISLARKLEKTFSIRLVEEDTSEKPESPKSRKNDNLTVGDLIKVKK